MIKARSHINRENGQGCVAWGSVSNTDCLVRNANISVGLFEDLDHLLRRYQFRIVGDGVDFAELVPTTSDLLDAGQPLQGMLANAISVDIEDNLLH